MFYCEDCRKKHKWPTSPFRSLGQCEMCKTSAPCHDTPSGRLPNREPEDDEEDEDDELDEAVRAVGQAYLDSDAKALVRAVATYRRLEAGR